MTQPEVSLIRTEIDTERRPEQWPENLGQPVIAGTSRIYRQLLDLGYNAINPDEAIGENAQREILAQVAILAREVPSMLVSAGFTQMEADLLACKLAMECFGQFAIVRVLDHAGIERSRAPQFLRPHAMHKLKPREKGIFDFLQKPDWVDRKFLLGSNYFLQFASHSGFKQDSDTNMNSIRVMLKPNQKSEIKRVLRNKAEIFNKLRGVPSLRYKISPVGSFQQSPFASESLRKFLIGFEGEQIADSAIASLKAFLRVFDITRASFRNWFEGLDSKPVEARFNYLGGPSLPGVAAAINDSGIEMVFRSHGALVVHDCHGGGSDRDDVAALFARAIYNEPEYATRLLPRSPMQIHRESSRAKVISKPAAGLARPASATPPRKQGPMRVFLAPNFLNWKICYHGMSQNCFETDHCIRVLMRAFATREDMELQVRIKTTTKDKGSIDTKKHDSGILSVDFNDLYDPSRGVFNVSDGSYAQLMEEADIVITEGVTAVMFEALENRKPVVLVNKYRSRVPSLPSWSIAQNGKPQNRRAVYNISADDDIIQCFDWLKEMHLGKPLENDEIRDYVWL